MAAAGPDSGSPLLMAELRHLGGALAVSQAGPRRAADARGRVPGVRRRHRRRRRRWSPGCRWRCPVFKSAMAPWDAGRGYLNFEESTVDSRSFYDEVTHRHLARIKAQVDPADIFRSNHPIAPAK